MQRIITDTLMQCWDCGHVQVYARVRACEVCQGPVEVLQTLDTGGVWVPYPLEQDQYRKRGVNILKVLAGSEEARYYPVEEEVEKEVSPRKKVRPEFMSGWVRVDYDEIKAATEKAVLFVIDDEDVWLPVSQLDADYSNEVGEGAGHVFVTEWIAKQKGF
jgi:hypothetical protein